GIARRDHERAVHALERSSQRLRPAHIALNHLDSGQCLQQARFSATADERSHRNPPPGELLHNDRSTQTRGSCDQNHGYTRPYFACAFIASLSSTGITTTANGVPPSSLTKGIGCANSLLPSVEFS